MATNFKQYGDVMPVTLSGTVTANSVVVVGETLGVALEGGSSGDTIQVALEGVFTCPKVSGAVIAAGESLVWDVSAGAFDDNLATPAKGDVSGPTAIAFKAAGNGATTLEVRFTGVPGTVDAGS